MTKTATRLEWHSETATRALAGKLSRRSFLGRVGRGAIAITLGAQGMRLLTPSLAIADHHPCPSGCDCSCSVSCNYLPGWNSNSCPNWPNGTCRCGSWCFNDNTCASGMRRWIDCCNTGWCGNHGGCKCIESKNRPTCCNDRAYSNGDCSPSPGLIVCRIQTCGSCAVSFPSYC